MVLRVWDFMDPRFGTLTYHIKSAEKLSSKAGKVHSVIVKSAGYSNLWTDFKYFKKEFIKNDL